MRADPRFRPIPLEAVTLLGEGRLVDAVKVVRQAEMLGLREAKQRVDAHIARDPMLRVQLETLQREGRRRFFFWFLIVDLVITAGLVYWFNYRGSV
jgi:hypothetical protein